MEEEDCFVVKTDEEDFCEFVTVSSGQKILIIISEGELMYCELTEDQFEDWLLS